MSDPNNIPAPPMPAVPPPAGDVPTVPPAAAAPPPVTVPTPPAAPVPPPVAASAAVPPAATPPPGSHAGANARIKRWSLWLALATIVVGAVLAIIWLLTGTSGGVIGRAFLTLAVLVGFAFSVLGEVSFIDRRHPVVTLIRLLILTATVGSALWLIWGTDHGWWHYEDGWSKLLGWFGVVASLQAAGALVSLAGWWVTTRSPHRAWSATMLIGSVLALGAFVMLAIPCTFQELRPGEFYWRLVAAFGIAAVACVIVPLTAVAMTRPKARRPPATAAEGTSWAEAAGYAATPTAGAPSTVPVPPGYPPIAAAPATHSALSVVGFVFAIVFAPVGLVISIVAAVDARRHGRQSGFAIAGIVIAAVITAFWALIIGSAIAASVQSQIDQEARTDADAAATVQISSVIETAAPGYADADVRVDSGYATIRLVTDPEDVTVHDYASIVTAIAEAYQDQETVSRAQPLWSFTIQACLDDELGTCGDAIPAAETLQLRDGWKGIASGSGYYYYYAEDFASIAALSVPPVGTPLQDEDDVPSPSPSVPALQD